MEWVTRLRGSTVAVDTSAFIYYIEEHKDFLPVVGPFFEALERGEFSAVTSTLTLAEVLVHPFRKGRHDLVTAYRQILLHAANLKTVDVTPDIAEAAARLRSDHNLRTPDAIHLATALHEGATSLLTNDAGLRPVAGLGVLVIQNLM